MNRIWRLSISIVAASIATDGFFLFAQSTSPPNLVPVSTILTVEARHDHDKNVPELHPEDVLAYERHERLQVTDLVSFTREHAGLELFLLLDDASSSSLGVQLGDVRHFIEAQPATTSIGVGYMRNGTVETVQGLTTDHAHAAKSLRLPLSSGGAGGSPYLSLSDLIKHWPDNGSRREPGSAARREVVMVTSGVDPLGGMGPMNPYLDSAIEDAQRNEIVVYAIYTPPTGHSGHSFWRLNWAQNYLAKLAEETGGEDYMLGFGPAVSFAPYLEEISARLGHQYLVTVLMKPGNKAGLRAVRFTTEVPNAELVAPAMVYVPAGGPEPNK